MLLLLLGAPLIGLWVFMALGGVQFGLHIWSAGHALMVARASAAPSRLWFQRWYWLVPFALVFQVSVVQVTEWFGRVDTFHAASGSMEPTFVVGDKMVVDSWHYRWNEPRRGDVVVIEQREDGEVIKKLKRIVALGGESISIENKVVLIDGVHLHEPFTQHLDPRTFSPKYSRDNMKPLLLPQDTVYVMGDNRDHSYDSRFFGPVPRESLLGRVQYVYESSDLLRIGTRPGPNATP